MRFSEARRAEFYRGLLESKQYGEARVLDALQYAADLPYPWLSGDAIGSEEADVVDAEFIAPAWWGGTIDFESQVVTVRQGIYEEPRPDTSAIDWTAWTRDISLSRSRWWSIPLGSGVPITSTRTESGLSVGLLVAEDDLGAKEADLLPASIDESTAAQVYDITTAADWVDLVDGFPVDVTAGRGFVWSRTVEATRWWLPDWPAVADAYAGIRLTTEGFFNLSGEPLAVKRGHTMLAGWGPDTTVWVRGGAVQLGTSVQHAARPRGDWTIATR